MTRVIKIDNALQKRFKSKNSKKKKDRDLIVYFLIVCEGEKTEPNYFESFPKNVGKYVFNFEFSGGGISTLKVVEKAIELRDKSAQKFDRVWAVFDRDSFKANSFNSAILKAAANGISCAWSNEAFELWYLFHFYNRITAMNRDEYKRALENAINEAIKKKVKSASHFIYTKNSTEMYSILQLHGNQSQAIKWAKEQTESFQGEKYSDFNPATTVYKLVLELMGQSKELIDELLVKYSENSNPIEVDLLTTSTESALVPAVTT